MVVDIKSMPPARLPVAIVGGGPTGLTASILLSLCKIPHVLFERYPSTSIHPKACGYNHRTIEVFRRIGIEPEIIKQRAPKSMDGQTAWYTSFGPNGREIVRRSAWGGGIYQNEYDDVSPCSYTTLPQIRLEPILQKRAQELNPKSIFYNTEVSRVEEAGDHVVLTLQRQGQAPEQVCASYCIGADGGRGLTEDLGIEWEGEHDIVDMVSAHVRAPISQHHPDIRNFITWFISPTLGGSIGSGYLYHLGPYPMSTDKEEWLFACGLNPNDPKRFDEAEMLRRMHKTLQIPDLKAELLSISHWYVNALCAKQYRSKPSNGRIFLVGDAAHRIPPWGALGLNTGIQDVYNLVWKLNLAIQGLPQAGAEGDAEPNGKVNFNALLDTYDQERKPIGQRVRTTSLHNLRAHSLVMDTALGLSAENSDDKNTAAMTSFLDHADTSLGASRRDAVDQAQRVLDGEFHALGAEVGWFYPDLDTEGEGKATNHDGQLDAEGNLDMLHYHPSTIPGHHLPHVWLERRWGGETQRVSTRDLVRYDGFVLLTSMPELWRGVVDDLKVDFAGFVTMIAIATSNTGTNTRTHTDADADTDPDTSKSVDASKDLDAKSNPDESWRDVDDKWPSVRGIGDSGAILVRPDGIVVWRAMEFDDAKHVHGYGHGHGHGQVNGNGHVNGNGYVNGHGQDRKGFLREVILKALKL